MTAAAGALDWVDALGWSLLHFIWQGAVVGAFFALMRSLVPVASCGIRYAGGLAAMAVLALCPVVTMWTLAPVDDALAPASAGSPAFVDAAATVDAIASSPADSLLPWIVGLWLAGVAMMFVRAFGQWRALQRIATRFAAAQADIDALLARVAVRFGGLHSVRVLVSRHIDTPTLIGWLNPVILLPTAVVLGFPRQQLELILAHELGHVRRYDHLVNLAQAIVETVLFYHPVVHWISRDVRHEREVCCDNLVLRLTERDPREYARTLAALEDLRQLPAQLAVAASGGMLLDRVRRIVGLPQARDARERSPFGRWLAIAATTGILIAGLGAWHVHFAPANLVADQPLDPFGSSGGYVVGSAVDLAPTGTLPVASASLPRIALPVARPREPVERVSAVKLVAQQQIQPRQILAAAVPAIEAPSSEFAAPVTARAEVRANDAHVDDVPAASLEVADRAAVQPPAPVVATTARPMSKVVRRVAPVYPEVNTKGSRGHVEFEFAIDEAGAVREIAIVSGDSLGAYAIAARRALRQWRFDPRSPPSAKGERFRQDFVFVGIEQAVASGDNPICPRDTGSHLCRPGRGVGMSTAIKVADSAEDVSSALSSAGVTGAL